MNTGYVRKRSRTPTRRSTRPKSFRTAVKNVLEASKETKSHRVLLTVQDTPQVDAAGSLPAQIERKLPYTTLYPGAWMTWGHLLSNIQTPGDGKVPNTFQRGGDEIHMKNIKFDLDFESSYSRGSSYRFVVWKTTRVRDYTMSGAADRNTASFVGGFVTNHDDRNRRFGGPPQVQTTQIGPLLGLDNVCDGGMGQECYKGQARDGGILFGMGEKPIYSTPVKDATRAASFRVDTDPMDAVFDRERCTILHDETIHFNASGGSGDSPMNKHRCTRYVSYDKDIEFSTEFASAAPTSSTNLLQGSLLALKNNSDYINCAVVCMPHESMISEAGQGLTDAQARKLLCDQAYPTGVAVVRMYATFNWKDKNIGVYG